MFSFSNSLLLDPDYRNKTYEMVAQLDPAYKKAQEKEQLRKEVQALEDDEEMRQLAEKKKKLLEKKKARQ